MTLVQFERLDPKVGKLTLNDPDNLNAMGEAMADEFSAIVQELRAKPQGLRALILTGAGRAFSAGGDLKMLEAKSKLSAAENQARMLKFYHSFLDLLELKIPLIAAINGHAIGAGLCVACACDIRIASAGAKLGFTFTKLGLHPGMGATYFLPKVVGSAIATELVITGRVIDSEEALRIGLVSKIVEDGKTLAEAEKISREILECGPQAVAQVLDNMRQGAGTLENSLQREAQCQAVNYASAEFHEGVRSVIEKRKAAWPG